MANNNHLVYITENGNLRTCVLNLKNSRTYVDLTCKPQEKYLITGLILGGQVIDSSNFPCDLISSGLNADEIFLMRSSNKMFQIVKEQFRQENTILKIRIEYSKTLFLSNFAKDFWGLEKK